MSSRTDYILDSNCHVLKDLAIGIHNIVRPGTHQPPLFCHRSRPLISIPHSLLPEEVCRDVFKPHRCQGHCDLLVKSLSVRSLQVHVEVSRKNWLCPYCPLHHLLHHIPNSCVVERCQVTVGPIDLSCIRFYRPAMVVIFVAVVVVAVVILRVGRLPR